ncbi:DUF2207 domain-containing protein [Streptomyces sp. NPDC058369]|uniref:DUF2207 domain-containing protein n=1 Tax=Streptomyces sp. NPDC058369 TaxID=3346462 RepID=UPI00366A19AD
MVNAKAEGYEKQGSRTRRRRARGLIGLVCALLLLGGVTWFAAAAGNTERVTRMWVSAQVAPDGSARVNEVIDYDFGHPTGSRHGIFRDIPGLTYEIGDEDVSVTMDGAPVPYELSYGGTTERSIRIGDAGRTVGGPHRYRISYPLPDVVKKGKLAWDAVGTGWKVDLHDVEVHVTATAPWSGARCVRGRTGSAQSCGAERSGVAQPTPGQLTARVGTLAPGNGVTLYGAAGTGAARDAFQAVRPTPPAGARPDAGPGPDPARTALWVTGLALACGLATVGALRLLGRDRSPAVLAQPAEGTPPEGLTPVQGGILLTERVEPRHKVAWLLDTANRGHLSITGTGQLPTLRRVPGGDPDEDTAAVLDDMFAGGRVWFTLGTYDAYFRSAWQSLGIRLTAWQQTSDLWDPAGQRRVTVAVGTGLVGTLLGVVAALTGAVLIGHLNAAGPPVAAVGAVLMGTGPALCFRAWELKRRTARGAALLAQVESFQHWLATTSPRSIDDTERLEQLTAWAVALGVAQRWERSIAAATAPPVTGARRSTTLTQLGPALAVGLIVATARSSHAPAATSSGGSGGFSGGGGSSDSGVGGGTGGGGGGSW